MSNGTTDTRAVSSEETTGETILRTEGLTKHFGGLTALSDVDVHIDAGEIVGLIGPNGAGKTTLFHCISGVHTPSEGRVWLHGEEITTAPSERIANAGLTRTFQHTRPIEELTVLENVMIGAHTSEKRRSKARETARSWLEFVDLADHADESAGDLTVGSQKIMELARALATEPELILVDEIMAGLTPSEKNDILDIFERIRANGTSLVVIEHDLAAMFRISDRVIVLDQGGVLSTGTPEEIQTDQAVIDSYIGEYDA
ncbi:ABC transporter ATP-binding protein [Halovivax gelatinilyticus]|uniref:ABC transporter ATP-binding protein n=1 Tax=Halovivax gelatinilyticus TaxID=2961597 RepID=UPI0020CA63F5|nr:ABC transporter ATP-binding protein [Halovivax gelatinilyticus]